MNQNFKIIEKNLIQAQAFFQRWSDTFEYIPTNAGLISLVKMIKGGANEFCQKLSEEADIMLLPSTCLGMEDNFVRFGLGRLGFGEALNALETYLQNR